MPLFPSVSGFQITGGTFIDNAGDINIHTTQLTHGQNLGDPEFMTEHLSRELSGPERSGRQTGLARVIPYGMSLG
jgi:hypothetical protein